MRTTIVAGVVLGFTLLTAAPALAAPEVSQQSCDAIGGTLTRDKGVKTCTLRKGHMSGGPEIRDVGDFEDAGFPELERYIGVTREVTVTSTTTTQRQKGNGPVTTTGPTTVVVDEYVQVVDCVVEFWTLASYEGWDSADDEECQTRGLLPAS